ncbi:MAG: DUF1501 domain-containing protein [Planctomycetia bacterium]|nr:DUF1501 domain-containing protein [Planctomycetia bacterium]
MPLPFPPNLTLRVRLQSRRGFLQAAFASAAAATAGSVGAHNAAAGGARHEAAAILFFLAGGPSHIDMYDMKPDAGPELRGPFQPIATRVPGLDVCELMPRHREIADRLAVIRSVTHNLSVHDDATHWIQTGYPLLNARQRGQTHPSQGSAVARLRGARRPGMAPYICIPEDYRTHAGFYEGAAYLGPRYLALNAGGDPSLGNYRPPEFTLPAEVTLPRLDDRRRLLGALDRFAQQTEASSAYRDLSDVQRQAVELTIGSAVREAFDLARETEATRAAYGKHAYGQGALLARRLVEAGASFVVINLYEKDVDWWDDHYTIEKNLRKRLPRYDEALAALISDLTERGLLGQVLVGSFGEFGRAPRIDANAGRGHWPAAMSAVLAGAGVRGGQIVGATTSDGARPRDRELKPADLLASIYHALGIDPGRTLADFSQRPIPLLPEGEPIRELF